MYYETAWISISLGMFIAFVTMSNVNYSPIEHKLEPYCAEIGSEIQSYDRDDELCL